MCSSEGPNKQVKAKRHSIAIFSMSNSIIARFTRLTRTLKFINNTFYVMIYSFQFIKKKCFCELSPFMCSFNDFSVNVKSY